MRRSALVFALVLAACGAFPQAGSVQPRPAESHVALPSTPAGQVVPAFLEAFNTGDPERIRAFAAAHLDTAFIRRMGGLEAAGAYWLNVYRQYGPLELRRVDAAEQGPEWYWFQSPGNRGWVGIQFHAAAGPPHRITRHPVDRATPPGAPAPPEVSWAGLPAYLDAYLQGAAAADVFSGVVLVARDGVPVFQGAYGDASKRHGVPNHLDTRFSIASTGKLFTAVAVAQLVEQGRISLDDPIGRHIPEYPRHFGERATIRHLLTHTAGVELDTVAEYEAAVREAQSVAELLRTQLRFARYLPDSATYAPLARLDYTNEGIDLLGVIIERVSGQTYDEYLRDHVFAPAGMRHSGVDLLASVPHLATGYTTRAGIGGGLTAGPRLENARWLSVRARPSGNHFTTAGDLLLFANALRAGTLIRAETLRLFTAPQFPAGAPDAAYRWNYGLAFEVIDYGGERMVGHSGSFAGVSTQLEMYPERGLTLIVLSNYDFAAFPVADHIRAVLLSAH